MLKNKSKSTKPKPGRLALVTGSSSMDKVPLVSRMTRGLSNKLNFPPLMRRVLRYSDSWSLAMPAGSTTSRYFKVNSCYDPDGTGTGHQPRSFDQFCSSVGPYQVYRVLGVKAKVQAMTFGQGGATPQQQLGGMVVAGFSTSGSYPTAPSGSVASNIWGDTEIPGWSGLLINSNSPAMEMSFDRSMESVFGIKRTHLIGEDNYQGTYGADPTDLAFFYVGYQVADYTTTTQPIFLAVSFSFDVLFEDPIFNQAS